jgi:uncharacterized DUF497 family protein
MIFEWDEAKNQANIRKHGFDLADAEQMFDGLLVAEPDTRQHYGEARWRGIGLTRGCTAHVVFTERGSNTIRIISLRKATGDERKQYEDEIKNRLEAN